MCRGARLPGWTAFFLVTTVLTSATGFLFHSASFGPPHVIGVLSLVILAVALIALYRQHLAGSARWLYIAAAILALYLNVFVGVIQAFQKIPLLHALAPTQQSAPFVVGAAAGARLLRGRPGGRAQAFPGPYGAGRGLTETPPRTPTAR